MISRPLVAAVFALVLASPLVAADNLVERLATCQESWYDNRENAAKMQALVDTFNSSFKENSKDRSFVPKGRVLVAGLPVVQAFPQNVGMGVGFSVVVEGSFEKTKAAVEKVAGKTLTNCDTSDGMRTCDAEIAEKRTITLLAPEHDTSNKTLIGCYYFYEK